MIDWLTQVPLKVVFVPVAMVIAYFKGRRLVLWGVLGYLLGPLAVVIVGARQRLPRKEYKWLEALRNWWIMRGIGK